MRRGDLVTVALQGDQGKPRPALVIQSDYFSTHPTVTILPVTSDMHQAPLFRVDVVAHAATGLRKPSQVMLDKAATVTRERIGGVIGALDASTLQEVDRRLAVFLGIAK